jgi:hypothetical protein
MSKSSSGNGKFIVGAIIAIIIGGAAIVAISSSGSDTTTSSGNISEFSEVTVTGESLPAFDSASTDRKSIV